VNYGACLDGGWLDDPFHCREGLMMLENPLSYMLEIVGNLELADRDVRDVQLGNGDEARFNTGQNFLG
jgi:hypothetical protein